MSSVGFRTRLALSAGCRSANRICRDVLYSLCPSSRSAAALALTWRLLTHFSRHDIAFVPSDLTELKISCHISSCAPIFHVLSCNRFNTAVWNQGVRCMGRPHWLHWPTAVQRCSRWCAPRHQFAVNDTSTSLSVGSCSQPSNRSRHWVLSPSLLVVQIQTCTYSKTCRLVCTFLCSICSICVIEIWSQERPVSASQKVWFYTRYNTFNVVLHLLWLVAAEYQRVFHPQHTMNMRSATSLVFYPPKVIGYSSK